ncbi:MAG: hypothetical protein N2C12_12630 [Planctomycetales bacterium]
MSSDDPPAYLVYTAEPGIGNPQKDPTHTSIIGVSLQEHLRTKSVLCELVYPGAANVQHETVERYLIAKLGSDRTE